MKISHVIRGEEWLPSLGLHWLLYEAFDWEKPKFIHLPLILKPVGKGKLSKRDGDRFGFPVYPIKWASQGEGIEGYRERGYLPEATVNFLALLGWNPGSEKEIFSLNELTKLFSAKGLNSSGARFDPEKIAWFNQQHILLASREFLEKSLQEELNESGVRYDISKIPKIIDLIRPRLDLMTNVLKASACFFEAPKTYDQRGLDKLKDNNSFKVLKGVSVIFQNSSEFSSANLRVAIQDYTKASSLNFGNVLGLIRMAVVGELSGAGLFDIIELIEKTEAVKRVEALADYLNR
jgi:glutamyl-tRNA synthetase